MVLLNRHITQNKHARLMQAFAANTES